MKAELRELLGKVVHEVTREDYAEQHALHETLGFDHLLEWEYIDSDLQELNRKRGEAVARELLGIVVHAIEQFKFAIIQETGIEDE